MDLRLFSLVSAVVTFLIVAALTVHFQVRSALRCYQLSREYEERRAIVHQSELVRVRVEGQYSPVQLHGAARRLRDTRDGRQVPEF